MDSRGRLFVGDRENNRIQIFDQDGRFLDEWRQFGRPSGIVITRDDTIYVADSESGPDTGARELPGIKKGIRIGSARDGRVTAFIEDMESTTSDHSGAEGVGVDAQGNVYGGVVRRQMLERHVKAQPGRATPHGHARRIRTLEEGHLQLGTLGQGRSARRAQPDYAGEAQAGGGAGQRGRLRVARP